MDGVRVIHCYDMGWNTNKDWKKHISYLEMAPPSISQFYCDMQKSCRMASIPGSLSLNACSTPLIRTIRNVTRCWNHALLRNFDSVNSKWSYYVLYKLILTAILQGKENCYPIFNMRNERGGRWGNLPSGQASSWTLFDCKAWPFTGY